MGNGSEGLTFSEQRSHKVSVSLDDGEDLMLCEQCSYSYDQHTVSCYFQMMVLRVPLEVP
jgi:hypothetical protein